MNYYEQFYDDLDLLDHDEAPRYRRGPHPHEDSYDPRFARDYLYEDERLLRSREFYDRERAWDIYERERARDFYERERAWDLYERERRRPVPYDVERRPLLPELGRGQKSNFDSRGRGTGRGRGVDRGRGRGADRGKGAERGKGADRGRGRGFKPVTGQFAGKNAGNGRTAEAGKPEKPEEHAKPKGQFGMTFVKAGELKKPQVTKEGIGQNSSETIRFDYKSYQNQRSETEKEVEQALKAYSVQLGFGYGYGPRSDLIDGSAEANWIEHEGEELASNNVTSESDAAESKTSVTTRVKQEPGKVTKPVITKAVRPEYNFVKAKSEFKSTDVAFHETEDLKPKQNHLSVNMGNKRIGLGFGTSSGGTGSTKGDTDISEKFYAGVKDGCNLQFDQRFQKLHQAVKMRNNANKNGIEVLHMAVDKVKMAISDDIKAQGRTPYGQPKFLCRLLIDGVYVAEGHCTAKKAAKHEAYANAVKLLLNDALTVKEISKGVFELKQKEIAFKVPVSPAMKTGSGPGVKGQGQTGGASQQHQNPVLSKQEQLAALNKQDSAARKPVQPVTQAKPKIVFHQASNPMADKPLEFKTPTNPPQSGAFSNRSQSVAQPPKEGGMTSNMGKSPAQLATKLLNFVKEGESFSNDNWAIKTEQVYPTNINAPVSGNRGKIQSAATNVNPRKRPFDNYGNQSFNRFKVKKVGKGDGNTLDDLSQFIIVDSSDVCEQKTHSDLTILHNSANFNKVVLKVEYENCDSGVNCSFVLSDEVIATAHGMNRETAKVNAARETLEELREMCYTVRVKQDVDSASGGLTKEQLMSDIQRGGEMLPDSNIGSMLLKKMGWAGGGVGKDGQGIAEPVKAEMVIGREGLGLKAAKGIGQEFNRKVTKLLEDYVKSDDQNDLHFTSELSKEERAIIHNIGQKMGLKTNSKGQGDNRYLIISRKRSAQELLDHVIESGGATSKYEVIPPRCGDNDCRKKEDIMFGHGKQ